MLIGNKVAAARPGNCGFARLFGKEVRWKAVKRQKTLEDVCVFLFFFISLRCGCTHGLA